MGNECEGRSVTGDSSVLGVLAFVSESSVTIITDEVRSQLRVAARTVLVCHMGLLLPVAPNG